MHTNQEETPMFGFKKKLFGAKVAAKKIENRLAAKGMTRAALIRAAGIPKTTFERHMANKGITFTVAQVFAIADSLEVHAADIMPTLHNEEIAA